MEIVFKRWKWGLSALCYGLALSGIAAGLALPGQGQRVRGSEDQRIRGSNKDAIARPIVNRHSSIVNSKVDYNRDVQPILAKHCWPCHGADKAVLATTGNMRLDTFEGATQDRGGYRAIVPHKPDDSMLIKRINAEEGMRMPPATAPVEPLSDAQKAILRQWILEGAEYKGHWAFEAPKKPVFPNVKDKSWLKNDIDRFILAKLDTEGLKPEKEADKATLIRRASLTLTGLPPTPQELQAFLNDKSKNAYEQLVDRLLASPRYGENQARYWLDAVRYADTHGLHIDNERAVFPYRDWVVRAFNEDLSFDKFTIWQLAGDLLPNPTLDQMIATGYVRMNPTTNEGGVIEAEFLAKNTMDRVDTTSTIFLGLTMGCAKCHDHKYDPITTKDYYSMYAFFNSTQDPVLDGNLKLHQPVMKAPTPLQSERLARLAAELRKGEDAVELDEAKAWLQANAAEIPTVGKWEVSGGHVAKSFDEAFDKDFGPEPGGLEPEVAWKPFDLKQDQVKEPVAGKDNAAGYVRTTIESKKGGEFGLRLGSDDGIKVWVNGELAHSNKVLRAPAPNQDSVKIKLKPGANEVLIKIVNAGGGDGVFFGLGDARSRRLGAALAVLERESTGPSLNISSGRADGKRPKADEMGAEVREAVSAYLELGPDSEPAKSYRKTLASQRKLDEAIPFTYIAKEMKQPRPTYVLKRGHYETPGEKVDRNIPKFLGDWIPTRPRNRLGFAQWLVDRRNPLTARVIVNQIWQQHFGQGLVKSAEDFGTRGEWPSHPELLDYLAVKFVQDGWSIKKLHKLILSSAAYRQSSRASLAKRSKDPENRLISRGPRFRLDAEVLRDQALYLSGLLVEKPGGRGDKPYQPPGLWEIIAYPISDTAKYVQDNGEALYRRSLYLFWKRTSPPPAMMIFDAPMRESCVVRRSRTNTPTQALVTLNETGFFEAARNMAERLLALKKDNEGRLDFAFRASVGRSPTARETEILLGLLHDRLMHYRSNQADATNLLSIGESKRSDKLDPVEHAAWTLVCNAILNLDEVMTLH